LPTSVWRVAAATWRPGSTPTSRSTSPPCHPAPHRHVRPRPRTIRTTAGLAFGRRRHRRRRRRLVRSVPADRPPNLHETTNIHNTLMERPREDCWAPRTSRGTSAIVQYNGTIHSFRDGWLGSRVVSVFSGAEGPGFKSQPRRCRVTVLGKRFTPIVPLFTEQRNW